MNPISSLAEAVLGRHPFPALRLSELLELVAERVDRALDARRLRAVLEEHPERFRVFDPWRGPWRSVVAAGSGGNTDPWVVLVSETAVEPDVDGRTALTLRESVRWLGRTIDARSATDVGRWYAIVLSERASRRAVTRRAA